MMKLSMAQVGQMMKTAAENLRNLSAANTTLQQENQSLQEKVAHYVRRERVERIATTMEEKGLEANLSFEEKVAGLMKRDNLDVLEEAVGLTSPQMKVASVHDDGRAEVDDDVQGGQAAQLFAAALASL